MESSNNQTDTTTACRQEWHHTNISSCKPRIDTCKQQDKTNTTSVPKGNNFQNTYNTQNREGTRSWTTQYKLKGSHKNNMRCIKPVEGMALREAVQLETSQVNHFNPQQMDQPAWSPNSSSMGQVAYLQKRPTRFQSQCKTENLVSRQFGVRRLSLQTKPMQITAQNKDFCTSVEAWMIRTFKITRRSSGRNKFAYCPTYISQQSNNPKPLLCKAESHASN
jgi:hypothetical protein